MSIRMLIDASHQEETRVAIVDGNKLEDFDYESSAKKQLKGSIYLAKVTRVEPSLQAAFVDYGGNRHGFLAFSEIHPDYYQIPVADREALIAEEAAANADLLENEDEVEEAPKKRRRRSRRKKDDATEASKTSDDENKKDIKKEAPDTSKEETSADADAKGDDEEKSPDEEKPAKKRATRGRKPKPKTKAQATKADEVIVEGVNETPSEETSDDADDANDADDADDNTGEDQKDAEKSQKDDVEPSENDENENNKNNNRSEEEEEERLRIRMAKRLRFKYKIQEVIKKNQIILVQVVKEERGNKGAALTTYLSLPGRYCVLMPNTLHGGGVSRKIANVKDRKKLKNVLSSLNMPKGHACIIRTAGSDRTKAEIKRDYDYLRRMWEAIRENTLKSIAPTQIYEEGNLIKRSIRDLYTRDVSEILVEGERGHATAKSFMQLLMPSHAKKIKNYEDPIPLFQRYQVENHLDAIYSPTAQLKSGGYIVINPTEALVSIDVDSGRATKEHNIEETALKTNLEAAEEVARQLKLRDMAGLVVIDFIDMEEQRNNRAVERKMKSCLKNDRARIQVGRISSFGLMEMSRQRLRVGVLESSTNTCPHCEGSGLLRSVESQALHILRIIEEEGIKARNSKFVVYLPSNVAVYILNNKRNKLLDLEKRYDFNVAIAIDNELTASAHRMERSGKPSRHAKKKKDSLGLGRDVNKLIDVTEEDVSPDEESKDRPRRRRRRRGGRNRNRNQKTQTGENQDTQADENAEGSDDNQEKGRRKRRPRRSRKADQETNEQLEAPVEADDKPDATEEKPKPRRARRKKSDDAEKAAPAEVAKTQEEKPKKAPRKHAAKKAEPKAEEKVEAKPDDQDKKSEDKPKKAPRKRAAAKKAKPKAEEQKAEEKPASKEPKEVKPKKKGWWSR